MEHHEEPSRGNGDRISSLPDHVLHLVMSFLTADEAVRLCMLSKRWENLWKTLPFLNFDKHRYACNIERGSGEFNFNEWEHDEPKRNINGRFKDFVNMTLLHREASANLDTFRLSTPMLYYDIIIRSWLLYVLKRNPRDLNITVTGKGSLPRNLFSCSSLVNLKISIYGSQNKIEFINLPCLRQLHLSCIFVDQDFLEKLFCGCPMLDFLHLRNCNMEFSSINSESLKRLKIERYNCTTEKPMELINAPNLLSFHYTCGRCYGCRMLLKMPSLSSASIFVKHRLYNSCYDEKSYILSDISSVKTLELNGFGVLDLLKSELNVPKFPNVNDLRVGTFCLHCHSNLLASFLDHFPVLEKLSLQHDTWPWLCEHVVNKLTMYQLLHKIKSAPFQQERLQIIIESSDVSGVRTLYEVWSGCPKGTNNQIDLSLSP